MNEASPNTHWPKTKLQNQKVLKDNFAEFKGEVLQELQGQNANIVEAQTQKADLESACLEMKDALLVVVKENLENLG